MRKTADEIGGSISGIILSILYIISLTYNYKAVLYVFYPPTRKLL